MIWLQLPPGRLKKRRRGKERSSRNFLDSLIPLTARLFSAKGFWVGGAVDAADMFTVHSLQAIL